VLGTEHASTIQRIGGQGHPGNPPKLGGGPEAVHS
jgi:hypothetical protein